MKVRVVIVQLTVKGKSVKRCALRKSGIPYSFISFRGEAIWRPSYNDTYNDREAANNAASGFRFTIVS